MKLNYTIYLTTLLFLFIGGGALAQFGSVDASQFEVRYKIPEVEFKEGEVVSNPLQIKNNSNRSVTVTLDMSYPPEWSIIGVRKNQVTIGSNDSIYIPMRLIPKGTIEGNTKYAINAMIRSEEGYPLGVGQFFCFTKKVVKWELNVGPTDVVYFRNDQDEANFDLTLENTGKQQTDFQVSLNGGNREDLLLRDTMGNIIRRPTYTIPLVAGEDTTLHFNVKPAQFRRNYRTVSLNNYLPSSITAERRFRYYAISEEAKDIDGQGFKRGTKVDFVRLANQKQISPYGSDYLPLTMEAQIQNILSDYSVMTLNLMGTKQIDMDSRLVYFSQLFFSQNYLNTELFNNTPWYVGYFKPKWDIQAGLVNGRATGTPTAGKGITGSYQIHPHHRIGGHITRSPNLMNARYSNYGVYHNFDRNRSFRISSNLSLTDDNVLDRRIYVANTMISKRLAKSHNLSLMAGYSISSFNDTTLTQNGYRLGLTYSGTLMDGRLRQNLGTRYASPRFGASNTELINVNNRTSFELNDRMQILLMNNLNQNNRYGALFSDTIQNSFRTFTNRISLVTRTALGTFQPGLYYDVLEQPMYTNHSRGITFNYNKFNFENNSLFTTTIQAGYNNPLNFPEIKEYFTASWSMLARVRTLSLNMRYAYGPSNPLMLTNAFGQNNYPKQFRTSLQHQYMFKNGRFVLQSAGSYAYNNQLQSHSIGIFPEMFYFSSTGWRFSVRTQYNYVSTDVRQATSSIAEALSLPLSDNGPSISSSFRVGVSVRKDIGIPIPFSKSKNHNTEIIAFYDLDGDGVHGNDEPLIENVVIRLGKDEVITNIEGRSLLLNMPQGRYGLTVIPLDAPKGWFPDVPDSVDVMTKSTLFIPFVRGIKVQGKVMIDLDKLTSDKSQTFDLSNIKISATNNKSYFTLTDLNGNFDFYLPNGEYTITFDENVLSDRFRIMQNDIKVSLSNDLENMFVTFMVVEKRRKVEIKKFGQ